jgi:hypothetical protein
MRLPVMDLCRLDQPGSGDFTGVFADGPRKQTFNLSQIPVLKPFVILV